jgi:hypothetical protein
MLRHRLGICTSCWHIRDEDASGFCAFDVYALETGSPLLNESKMARLDLPSADSLHFGNHNINAVQVRHDVCVRTDDDLVLRVCGQMLSQVLRRVGEGVSAK